MSLSTKNIIQSLVAELPEVKPVLDKSIQEKGDLYAYVFFEDLADYLVSETLVNQQVSSWTSKLLRNLESILLPPSKDPVSDLIATSFLKHLPHPTEDNYEITEKLEKYMGPKLKQQLQIVQKSNPQFIQLLIDNFPNLKPILDESIQDNEELLPHLLFADIARYCIEQSRISPLPSWIPEFLNYLEMNFSIKDDDPVSNVIAVSFLEYLPRPYESDYEITEKLKEYMGPKLKEQFHRIVA